MIDLHNGLNDEISADSQVLTMMMKTLINII